MKKRQKCLWRLVVRQRFTLVKTGYILVLAYDYNHAVSQVRRHFTVPLFDVTYCERIVNPRFMAITPYMLPECEYMEDVL